jgi:hypothetical protein
MRVVHHFVDLRTAGNPRARNRLALGGATLPPGLPSASPSPVRAEALHCRQADHASEHKGDQAETLNLT